MVCVTPARQLGLTGPSGAFYPRISGPEQENVILITMHSMQIDLTHRTTDRSGWPFRMPFADPLQHGIIQIKIPLLTDYAP
jgi:hypothetical protein